MHSISCYIAYQSKSILFLNRSNLTSKRFSTDVQPFKYSENALRKSQINFDFQKEFNHCCSVSTRWMSYNVCGVGKHWLQIRAFIHQIFCQVLFCFSANLLVSMVFLTYSFPMHPFSTPWKHQKTLRFFMFSGGSRERMHCERMD